jgi:hypothetical protein
LARQGELDTWNLHNHVIKLTMDCRLVENLIYSAQKMKLQPDERMDRNLENLRSLAGKITQEIFEFVQEREQFKWRNWEGADPDWLK